MDEEREKFIKEREERYSGKISYSIFAKYIGDAQGKKEFGKSGLLYIIDKVLYFEDFAPSPSILTLNRKSTYSKLEFNIDLKDITTILEVRAEDALKAIKISGKEIVLSPSPKGFWSFFTQTLLEIKFTDRPAMYFDCLKNDTHRIELLKYIK